MATAPTAQGGDAPSTLCQLVCAKNGHGHVPPLGDPECGESGLQLAFPTTGEGEVAGGLGDQFERCPVAEAFEDFRLEGGDGLLDAADVALAFENPGLQEGFLKGALGFFDLRDDLVGLLEDFSDGLKVVGDDGAE